MKKGVITLIVVIIVLVAGYLIWRHYHQDYYPEEYPTGQESSTTIPTSTASAANVPVPATSSTPQTPSPAPTQSPKVSIQNFSFSPKTLTVKVGTTVTWTNNDSVDHTITGDNGGFQSTSLSKGQGYQFTFTLPGKFTYHCSLHPTMTGTVIVTE